MARPPVLQFESTVVIHATPERVLAAFFSPDDLAAWWQVARSVTVPRPLGAYAVEWEPTAARDGVLGRLGGTLHGTVVEYRPGREFFVADMYWHAPDGESVGPMALEVRCRPQEDDLVTRLSVRQSAERDSPRWARYFEVVSGGWHRALAALSAYLADPRSRAPR